MRILLIEDNELNRDMLTRRLERKGYTVISAGDGLSGIDSHHCSHGACYERRSGKSAGGRL